MRRGFLCSLFGKNMVSDFLRKWRCVAAMFVVAVGGVCGAWGVNYTWTGGGSDTNWTTVANWGGSGYPGSSDTAEFKSGSDVTVTLTESVTVNALNIYNKTNTLTINLARFDLTVSGGRFNLGKSDDSKTGGNAIINGSGKVTVTTFDSAQDADCSLTL